MCVLFCCGSFLLPFGLWLYGLKWLYGALWFDIVFGSVTSEQNVSINLVKNGTSRRGASPLHAASATPQRPAPQRPAPQRPASPLIKVPQYSSQRATRTLVSNSQTTVLNTASHSHPGEQLTNYSTQHSEPLAPW